MLLADLAHKLGTQVVGDGQATIRRPVHPDAATSPSDIAMALAPELVDRLAASPARQAVVLAGSAVPDGAVDGYIPVWHPPSAMATVTDAFRRAPPVPVGIHPTAFVEPGAGIAADAAIGPFCHVMAGARIGPGTAVVSHVTVGRGAEIGTSCVLHPGVRIGPDCQLGDRVLVHQNASIGAEGFSYVTPDSVTANRVSARAGAGAQGGSEGDALAPDTQPRCPPLTKIHTLGNVVIGDDVEIGALSVIDGATLGSTTVGRGTKIDSLVMVGHNCRIGSHCVLCGHVGLAGSVALGDRVVLAGQAGIADHVSIGNDVVVGPQTGVGKDIAAGTVWLGFFFGHPARQHYEQLRLIGRLKSLFADVAALKKGKLTR